MTDIIEQGPAAISAERIRSLVVEAVSELGIDPMTVTDDSRLLHDLELDSTEKVQIALELTRSLGVKVSLKDAGDPPLRDVVALVLEQVGRGQSLGTSE